MQLVGCVQPGAFAISLTKGMRVLDSGPQLISQMVTTLTGMTCRLLAGSGFMAVVGTLDCGSGDRGKVHAPLELPYRATFEVACP